MAKPLREVDKPGEMGSLNKKTGKYSDRWLWEEISGEDFSGPPVPPSSGPFAPNFDHADMPLPPLADDPLGERWTRSSGERRTSLRNESP